MRDQIIKKVCSLGFAIEHQSDLYLKVRGYFKNHDVIISADHRRQQITIVSRSFRGHKSFSYEGFFLTYCC